MHMSMSRAELTHASHYFNKRSLSVAKSSQEIESMAMSEFLAADICLERAVLFFFFFFFLLLFFVFC